MALRTILSEKGKLLLIDNNFKFRKYREIKSSGELCWCCTLKSCRAKLYTIGPDYTFSRKIGEHNHNPTSNKILNRQQISNQVKRKAESELTERPRKLIHDEISTQKFTLETLAIDDIKRISKNINRARLQLCPRLPSCTSEVHEYLDSLQVTTIREEIFLLHNNKTYNIVIFSCKSNMEILCQQDIILVDGTFDYCTKYFLQMFTIHCYINSIYVPLVYCLLKDKKEQTYKNVFETVKSECLKLGYLFQPKHIIVDFEKAIQTAAAETLPGVTLVGCRFHLSQAW